MTYFPPWQSVPTHSSHCVTASDWDLWANFGNDDDGPQGEFIPPGVQKDDDGYPFGSDQVLCQERFERWQKRNPRHNMCFRVKRQKVINPTYIIGKPAGDFRREMNNAVVLRFNPFFSKVGPAIIGYRSDKPPWPAPTHGAWQELGPGGGAWDAGIKSYEFRGR